MRATSPLSVEEFQVLPIFHKLCDFAQLRLAVGWSDVTLTVSSCPILFILVAVVNLKMQTSKIQTKPYKKDRKQKPQASSVNIYSSHSFSKTHSSHLTLQVTGSKPRFL